MVKLSGTVRWAVVLMACVVFAGGAVAQAVDTPAGDTGVAAPVAAGPRSLSDYGIEGLDNRIKLETLVDWTVEEAILYLAERGGLRNVVIGRSCTSPNAAASGTWSSARGLPAWSPS